MKRTTLLHIYAFEVVVLASSFLLSGDSATAWPHFARPHSVNVLTIQSATSVGSGGGTSIINVGTGTYATTPACPSVQVLGGGTSVFAPVTSCTSTSLSATIPAMSAGTYDLMVWNVNGAGWAFSPGALTVNSTVDPITLWGNSVVGRWVCDNAAAAGTSCAAGANCITNLPDTSNAAANPLSSTGTTTQCSTIVNDPDFNGHTSCFCDGSAATPQYLRQAAMSFSGNTLFFGGAVKLLADLAGNNDAIYAYQNSNDATQQKAGTTDLHTFAGAADATQTLGVSVFGTGLNFMAGSVGNSATNTTSSISIDNLTATTNTAGSSTWVTTGGLLEVAQRSNADHAKLKFAELIALNIQPVSADVTTFIQYLNGKYATAPAPTIVATNALGASDLGVTRIAASTAGATFRINNNDGSYRPQITASVTIDSVTTNLTVNRVSPKIIEITGGWPSTFLSCTAPDSPGVPTCKHTRLTLTNVDTRTTNFDERLVVTSTIDPMVSEGINCIARLGDTCNGATCTGNPSQWDDLSLRGNNVTQSTGADQLTVVANDADFNSQLSLSSANPNTVQFMQNTAMAWEAPSNVWVAAICKQIAASGTQIVFDKATEFTTLGYGSTGIPQMFNGSAFQNWAGGALTGAHEVTTKNTGTLVGINADNGTETTASRTTTISDNAQTSLFFRDNSTSFFTGKCAAMAFFKTVPSLTNICHWSNNVYGTPNTHCP